MSTQQPVSDDLYQAAILDLAKRRTGAGRLEAPDASATVDNPLCGDRITLDLALDQDRITRIGHKTRGCVLCQAAASVIAEHAPGRARGDLLPLRERIARALREDPAALARTFPDLEIFSPVHGHKSRHDCVLLPFEALARALAEAETGA